MYTSNMPQLIFDIETIGEDFDKLDKITQENLTHWIKKEAESDADYEYELENIKNGLGFSPLTGEIAVIGVLDYDKNQGAIYFQAPGKKIKDFEENGFKFKQMEEKEMLEKFWELAELYDEFISFNGRGFDVPFLMLRSAINKVKPSKNLLSNRYLGSQSYNAKHIDLYDQFSFYGASRKKLSLHLCSRAFGIKSPKADGITGDDVGRLFKENKFEDIARYNKNDLIATKELFDYWEKYLKL
jgi:DNA polymerase elongation subunit (family B)